MSDTSGDLPPSVFVVCGNPFSLLRDPLVNLEPLLTCVLGTFLATEIRQKQHCDLVKTFNHIKMTKVDDDFQSCPCFNGLPSESLEGYTFEVEALVAGSKDDEKKLIGLRLVRRLGGLPRALARREWHMQDLAKPGGYKLILVFLEKKGYKKDALDRRLLANRRYEAIARRPGQTLQDFFATEHMTNADALKAGVGIDPDRCAYHMFIKSGLTDDHINHIYGFVYESEAEDHEQLWILERCRKLCSGSLTNLGTWIDTVILERLWAGTQDL